MVPPRKSESQLIEEIESLNNRLQKLEASLELYKEECNQKVEILESSHNYIQAIIDNIGDPVYVVDRDYRIVFANKKVRELTGGVDPVAAGLSCHQVSHHSNKPCGGQKNPCPLKKILKTKTPVSTTHTHYDIKGKAALVEIVATPIKDSNGDVVQIVEVCRDITKRSEMESALRQSEERYRTLFEQSSDTILILEGEGPHSGRILSVNKAACTMYGYTKKEILKLNISNLDAPEDSKKTPKHIKQVIKEEALRFELSHKKKDGTLFPVEVSASLLNMGGRKFVLAIYRDTTKRKKAEQERDKFIEELKLISKMDGLTGLLNRQYLDKRLEEEMKRAKRYENRLTLIMFDIDNFKKVNDTYGHIIGDRVLQKTAEIITGTLRDTDIAGRFGGDEFVLILVQTNLKVGKQVAERLRKKLRKARIPVKKGRSISFSISTGICQYNKEMKNIDEFILKADKAMYMAKFSGHNQVYESKT